MDKINWIIIKRALKILWLTLVAVTSVLFAGVLTLQLPQVQTSIASQVMEALSDRLDGNISIEKLHLKPFTTLVLKNTVITDKHPFIDPQDSTRAQTDTFFRAEYIIAKFSLEGILDNESIKIKSAYVGNAQMNLVLEDLEMKNDSVVQYDNLSRIFRIAKDKEHKEPSPEEIFRIRDVIVSDMGFSLVNRSSRKTPYHGGINWNDLDIKSIELAASGLRFKDGIMYGKAESLSFREKTGFICESMSGKARVGRGKTIVEDLIIKDIWSDISIPLFMMSYKNIDAFKDFIEAVRLDAELNNSVLDFRTIIPFAPQLEGNRLKATVSGFMSGCIDDFIVRDISIDSHDNGFSGIVNGRIRGIPDVYQMRLDADVTNLKMSIDGLGRFVSEWIPDGKLDLDRFGDGTKFYGRASAKGLLNHLNVRASLSSSIGSLRTSARLGNIINPDRPITIKGTLDTDSLDIGKIMHTNIAGPTTLHTDISLMVGKAIDVDINVLNIEKMFLNQYEYKDIYAKGKYDSTTLNGTVISKDPNLNFIFQGGYAWSEKSNNTVYRYDASIGHADLNAINIDKRGKSIVQFRTSGNFTKTGDGNLAGRIDAGEIMLENNSGRYNIGDIVLTSHNAADNKFQMHLNSDFAEAFYSGTASFVNFLDDLSCITTRREVPALSSKNDYSWKGHSYSLDFICHDLRNVLAFAVPGLYIEDGSSFNAKIDPTGDLNVELQSKRLAFKKNYMRGLNMSLNNHNSSINGELKCEEAALATIKIYDNLFQLHANDNHFGAGFSFDNNSDPETKGEIIINGNITREEESPIIDIDIRPSALHYNSKEWNIQPSNIRIYDGDINIDSFGLISGEQSVGIFGKFSQNHEDLMTLHLERFDLSIINALLPSDFGVRGIVTGSAELKSPADDMELAVDMVCDSSYIANVPLGVLKAGTTWNDSTEEFDIFAWNDLDGRQNLNLSGKFTPKSGKIKGDVELKGLNIGYVQPFMTEIFSRMEGYISGKFHAEGPLNKIKLRSTEGRLDGALLEIAYTGVPYTTDGPFRVDENGVYFEDITIRDRHDGTGVVSGSINYDHFRNISFDTKIKVNQIEAINLTEKEGDTFYGNLYGSGELSITGPVNAIVMDINAVTEKTGQLHIPMISSVTSAKETNLLRFKELEKEEYIDPYEIFVKATEKKEVSASDFLVRLKVNAKPDVEAFVEIDKANGNVLSGRGSGNISLEVSDDIFNINGDYTLNSGNYKFVAMGLVGKDFTIQDGSSIRFNGDIMESTLDINAIYKTKASLSTLISDTTSVATRRVVECGIGIKDKLSSPQLSFSIEIPDLDPTIKSRVESALSTEDKVQKQFLALIISNNFLPDEQSGIVNNTSALYSSVAEMMSSQINTIFQKLDIPLDLGLNYQPNERGNDIFDVAITTQLFNNRVVVNGNIGNRQYSSGSTQNEVAGDIDIEIKLDRSGAFRLNLFSHSADQYTNFLDNSQRNGVGITYQTEFNTFRQFFRNIFSSKKKRIESRRIEENAALNAERVKITIEAPEN